MNSEETIAAADFRRVSKRWLSQAHVLIVVSTLSLCSCQGDGPQVTRLHARPVAPVTAAAPGVYGLGMGTWRLRDLMKRDGTLVIPKQVASRRPLPLIVLLHGGGGAAEDFRSKFLLADDYGVVMLALDSRHNTWDGIDSPFGPDVMALDAALRFTFERVAIDPKKIALGGLSDGGAYALSLGIANGDLFTHLVAVSPGFYAPPAPPIGRPRIFLAHGTRDNVYSVAGTRGRIVPQLKDAGYDVTYFEFDGPHWVTEEAARRALEWFVS
jgi:phospholipase/carboxylesterase